MLPRHIYTLRTVTFPNCFDNIHHLYNMYLNCQYLLSLSMIYHILIVLVFNELLEGKTPNIFSIYQANRKALELMENYFQI